MGKQVPSKPIYSTSVKILLFLYIHIKHEFLSKLRRTYFAGLSALLAGSQGRQSAPNLSLEEEGRSSANTSSNNSTEMTAQFNLSDSPRLSNTNTSMKVSSTAFPLKLM